MRTRVNFPILDWIGLVADGLSSASYGSEEAFRALRNHTYPALVWRGENKKSYPEKRLVFESIIW